MLTASIVTYRTDPDELRRCMGCLERGGADTVYVCDNSPTPALRAVAKSYANCVYIHIRSNPGYGAAHNAAIRRALKRGADYHLVVNSDVWFQPAILAEITAYMDAHPDVGQLQPRLTNPDGSDQHTCRLLPTPLDVFGRRFLPARWIAGRDRRYTLADRDMDAPADIPYHQGSFMMLRTQALRECGMFDERFFMYPEDIDLTRRIHQRYRTLYWPGATAVHAHRAASYKSWRMTWVHCVNMARYFNKWGWWLDPLRRRDNRRCLAHLPRR